MVDIDKVSDDLTYRYEYDDGDTDTYGRTIGSDVETAKDNVLALLRADLDEVDTDALTITCVGE